MRFIECPVTPCPVPVMYVMLGTQRIVLLIMPYFTLPQQLDNVDGLHRVSQMDKAKLAN